MVGEAAERGNEQMHTAPPGLCTVLTDNKRRGALAGEWDVSENALAIYSKRGTSN